MGTRRFETGLSSMKSFAATVEPVFMSRLTRAGWVAITLTLTLAGCVTFPEETRAPAVPSEVFVYPSAGQSETQTDRDRYECHLWAVKQSRYDPSLRSPQAAGQVHVTTVQPGAITAAGAVTGAILGAAVAGPRDAAGGAIVGAIAGTAVGAAADTAQQQQAARERQYAADSSPAQAYRRAISACLTGRGYTVQ